MKAFDQGMTKIAPLGEVPPDSFRAYQTGGVLILVAHETSEVYAVDASCVELDRNATGNELIRDILDCVAPGSATDRLRPSGLKDDPTFRALPRLPCVVEDGWIWVRTD
jgi:nitrite reductase/ring-hydroxylating ferredoxin subunit